MIDVKLGDADAETYNYEPMKSLPSRWENTKKDKHGKHCHNKQKLFLPFVLSVDGILGKEALVVISKLSRVMAEKREEPLSASTGVGKRTHRNHYCKVPLTDDPRRSPPQYPAGTGAGLGPVIGDWYSRLNYMPG